MSTFIQRYAGALQLVFVIAVIGAALLLSASLKPDAPTAYPVASRQQIAVTVVEPAQLEFKPIVKLNGVAKSRTVTSVIPQVAGLVVGVSPKFRPGASVSKGDVLFSIDPSDYELAIDRTLAEIEAARSDLARLEAEGAAERQIWERNQAGREIPELRARIPQIAAAKARIHSGEAARRAAELELARTVVRAPFDARVLESSLDAGQVVNGSTAVGSIFSTASLEISVPVSADELRRIGRVEGRSATIIPQVGPSIAGVVVRKAASVDDRTRLGTLFVASEDSQALVLGEFVGIAIEGEETQNAFRLPATALTSRDQLWVVEGSQLAERRVEVLGREVDALIVSAFDTADGVVAIPPSGARVGLVVDPLLSAEPAARDGMTGASE